MKEGLITKDQIIERLCALSSSIADELNDHTRPYDCFCKEYRPEYFRFDEWFIEYIEEAVREKLKHEKSLINLSETVRRIKAERKNKETDQK